MRRNTAVATAAVAGLILVAVLASPKASDSRRWERESQLTDPGDDPRYKAAEAEARRRWPEFVAAFEKRGEGDSFTVKSAFSDGKHTEWMWLRVEAIETDAEGNVRIKGKLTSDPVYVRAMSRGAGVTVTPSDVGDWTYTLSGGAGGSKPPVGGFTEPVLKQIRDELRE